MAIIFMDSFDHYATANVGQKYAYVNGDAVTISVGGGRRGTSALYLTNNDSVAMSLPRTPSTVILGVAMMRVGGYYLPAAPSVIRFNNDPAGVQHCYLGFDASYRLYVARGSTTLATGTTIIEMNKWYYLEFKVKIHDTLGTVQLRLNGVNDFTPLTGQDTSNGSPSTLTSISIGPTNVGATYFDDLYVCDDTGGSNDNFLGDTAITYCAPSGSGVRTNFTPYTLTNWQNVDDATPNDNDYNSSNVVGATDLFAMPDIGNGTVHGVQSVLRYKKDDAGSRTVQPVFYRADVDDGGDPPPSMTSRWYRGTKTSAYDSFWGSYQILDTSPLSGLSWTKDEINALQYGYAVGDAAMFTIDAKLV